MKKFIIFFLVFFSYILNSYANLSNFKNFLEKSPVFKPFHIIQETTEKISSLGLSKLFFGLTAGSLIYDTFKKDNTTYKKKDELNKNRLSKVNSIGQIHINNIDENEAKRRALEDALYYAAIKGGAKIDGFSSIKSDTSIQEYFTVRPKSKIIDYKILKSYIDNDIYIVEIEAVIGDISMISEVCNINKPLIIREFKGSQSINTSMPASLDSFGKNIIDLIGDNLSSIKNITYYDNKEDYFNFNKENFDLSFDYKTLVNSSKQINYGDYIYIPHISLTKSTIYPATYLIKNNKKPNVENSNFLLDTDVLKATVSIEIYNGISGDLISKIDEKYLVPLNLNSNFELIKLFTKNDKEYIYSEIFNIATDLSEIIRNNLSCKPLTANINYLNNKLIVPLGIKNGIRKNQLAVLENMSEGNTSNWILLSVNSLTDNSATLIPLNSNVKISQLSGKKTRFLE